MADWYSQEGAAKLRNQIFIDLPTFPLNCLPRHFGEFVQAAAANIQVVPDMVAAPLLAIMAACVQRKFQVRIDSNYTEPLCLYTVTIARPSERKSAVLSLLRKPLWDYAKAYNERNALEKLTLYVDDVTPEKLAKLLKENKGSISIVSDEPDALEVAAGLRYGNGNLGLLLQAWSGGSLSIQRVTDDRRIYIDRATVSIAIMSQPRFIQNIMGNADMTERGFTQRLLFVQPKSLVGSRTFIKPDIPEFLTKEYAEIVTYLLDAALKEGPVLDIKLNEDARLEADSYFQTLETRLVEELTPMEGWAGKLFGQVLRIAGILHCMNYADLAADNPINYDEMLSATVIGDYFLEHAKAIYLGVDADPEFQQVRHFWERLRDSGKDTFTLSEISRLTRVKSKTQKTYLDFLVKYNFLHKEKIETEGRPAEAYSIVKDLT